MKLLKYIGVAFMGVTLAGVMNSCDITDLEAKDSPNALTPGSADLSFFVNSMQENYVDLFEAGNELNMEPVRMIHMFGPLYRNAYIPQSFDTYWSLAYATILQDVAETEVVATDRGAAATNFLALAKIYKAMTYVNLVDMFGDVPFTEANTGADALNPNLTGGQAIYDAMVTELDEAIALLEEEQAGKSVPEDFFYGTFSPDNWINVANTLKMKIFLNTGNGAGLTAVITDGRIIDDPSEDFQWFYSSVNQNPDSRHPQFGSNYDNGAADYMSNDYMTAIVLGPDPENSTRTDPRTRYYFYRQSTSNSTDPNEQPCINFIRPSHYPQGEVFCNLDRSFGAGQGYWGRDHGDDDGIPPDNTLRTIWGVYPAGGQFDGNEGDAGALEAGAAGAGISPIFLSSYTSFMRAEAAQKGLTGEDARAQLELAIRASIDKVVGFPDEIGYILSSSAAALAPSDASIDDYVASVLAEFDAASGAGQLEIIIREYWIALWGNGYEGYNAYRRTGFPSNLQPTIAPDPGDFINSHFYSANSVNRNSNIDQKASVATPVFWQTNTDLD